jgi:predicted metal-dependent enzyme (double-stranded beta helix superfamily)
MATQTVVSGCKTLCTALDAAVAGGSGVDETTQRVERTLKELIRHGDLHLPENLCRPCGDCYARRLVYKSEELGYTVVAMVWGVGQGTPLHDHNGMWCVEAVVDGRIEVVQYELVEEGGGRYRFEARGTVLAGPGSAGSLIPPFEYHTMTNVDPRPSISIHVYQSEMMACRAYRPGEDGWHEPYERRLSYSA